MRNAFVIPSSVRDPQAIGNRDIERPENSPVDCMDASLDALWALQ